MNELVLMLIKYGFIIYAGCFLLKDGYGRLDDKEKDDIRRRVDKILKRDKKEDEKDE